MKTDQKALFKLGYGLYVVTVNDGVRDSGLIVNTVMQQTGEPCLVSVTVSKANYSHDVIKNTGKMNVNCLTEGAPFSVFETFGFQSGREVDKFKDGVKRRSENGLAVLTESVNAFLSLEVEQYLDLGTHGLFLCRVTESEVLGSDPSMTYAYYHAKVKPKPQTAQKKGYVCKICGYVYEGEPLPPDFICPWCKHGAEAFEPIK